MIESPIEWALCYNCIVIIIICLLIRFGCSRQVECVYHGLLSGGKRIAREVTLGKFGLPRHQESIKRGNATAYTISTKCQVNTEGREYADGHRGS